MQTLHKYPIEQYTGDTIRIKGFVAFLDLQIQHGEAVVWVLIDEDDLSSQYVQFKSYLTGFSYDIDPKSEYLGTLQFDNGAFVRHYYAIYK